MRRPAMLIATLWLALAALPAHAVQPDEMLADPALEARARALSQELRCLICQNQSIDDSDAPIAHDLRLLLRERLVAGDSDDAVIDFLVARYGEFILLKPRFSLQNALLWLTPVIVLVAGAGLMVAVMRRGRSAAPVPLTVEEEARLTQILAEDGAGDRGLPVESSSLRG